MHKLIKMLMFVFLAVLSTDLHAKAPKKKKVGYAVVVPIDTPLFTSKNAKTPFVHAKGRQGFVTLNLLSEEGQWLKLAQRGWVKDSCYRSMLTEGVEIDFWVKKKDVARVTIQPTNVKLKGKSSAKLGPGVAIRKNKIWLSGHAIPVKISSKKLSYKFKPKRMPVKGARDWPESKMGMEIGGVRIQSPYLGILTDSIKKQRGNRIKAKVSFGCALLHGYFDDVIIPEDKKMAILGTLGGIGFGGLALVGGGLGSTYIRKGSQVYWANGEQAGLVTNDFFYITNPPVGQDVICKKMYPFPSALSLNNRSSFELCISSKDLLKTKPRTKGSSGIRKTNYKSQKAPQNRIRVTFSNYAIEGALKTNLVIDEIEKSVGAFRYCQDKVSDSKTKSTALFKSTFTIGSDGRTRILDAKIAPTKQRDCIDDVLKKLSFRKSDGNTDVNFTVKFAPVK